MNIEIEIELMIKKVLNLSLEFVNNNINEVSEVFLYCNLEDNIFIFKNFYKINGKICGAADVNNCLENKIEINWDKLMACFSNGNDLVKNMYDLLIKEGKKVPTLIKARCVTFNMEIFTEINFYLQYSNSEYGTFEDAFFVWFDQEKYNCLLLK